MYELRPQTPQVESPKLANAESLKASAELKEIEELRSKALAASNERSKLKKVLDRLPIVRFIRRMRGVEGYLTLDVLTIFPTGPVVFISGLYAASGEFLASGAGAAIGFAAANGIALLANRSAEDFYGDEALNSEGATVTEIMDGVKPEFYGLRQKHLEASERLNQLQIEAD